MTRLSAASILAFAVMTTSTAAAADGAADLKVSRVALFSSGVGFFQCEGTVDGDAVGELKFRTDQINDILKSLVVQDLDGGAVGVVGYASRDPVDKTLRSFGVDITGKPSLGQLLDQLRGEPVEIAGPRAAKGVILGVEKQTINVERQTIEIELLNLVTDAGIQQIRLAEVQGLKLANDKVQAELNKALATLAASHDADKKSVVIHFNGKGRRRVRAAYLLEAPIWKTTYRLMLDDQGKPFLQGWATVENATEEDWNDVQLSLVSGRPISFRMDLYTPLYVPRPMEQLELYASLRPPEYEGGFGREKKDMAMRPAAPAPAAMAMKSARGRAAGDRVAQEIVGVAGSLQVADAAAPTMNLADAGVASAASGSESGELFEYRISAPVSVGRQRSAMLPIVNQAVEGEKLSIFNPATDPKHPLNGLMLKNTSGLNLTQGPITLFDASVYAGDAKLPDMRPDEQRLLAYALDLACDVMVEQKPFADSITSLRIVKGTLWHQHKLVDERVYSIKNKAAADKTVLIEHATRPGWTLVEPKEPFEKTEALLRFKVPVAAGKTVQQTVRMENITDQAVALTDADTGTIAIYLRSKVISPRVKEALQNIVAMRTALDQTLRAAEEADRQRNQAREEQARVRENLRTLREGSDQHQRQLKKFDEFESRIEQFDQQATDLRQKAEQQRRELETYLSSLTLE